MKGKGAHLDSRSVNTFRYMSPPLTIDEASISLSIGITSHQVICFKIIDKHSTQKSLDDNCFATDITEN